MGEDEMRRRIFEFYLRVRLYILDCGGIVSSFDILAHYHFSMVNIMMKQ